MQGWSPDFISGLTEKALAEGLVDEIVPVNGNEAMRLARELATQEGIFVGTSSGATLAAALDVARRAPRRQPHRLHAARHRRALPVDAAVRGHRRRHERRGAGALALDAGQSLRRAGAAPAAGRAPARLSSRRGREPVACASTPAPRRYRHPGHRRQRRRHVLARVVRVLLGGAQAARPAGHRLRERRPRLGGAAAGRPGHADPRRAEGAHRLADHSADLDRRHARRRRDRPVRGDARRPDAAAAGRGRRRRSTPDLDIDPTQFLPKWLHPRKAA